MKPQDYPAQDSFTKIGALYHDEVLRRAGTQQAFEVQHGDNAYQSLAVHPAKTPSGIVLCVMHGGGWTNGYKEWMAFMAPALNARDVTLVSLGYRLAPQHIFPAGFNDCCDGIAWVWQHINEHGGDPGQIFVSGHSAGGHYAALMALQQDWQGSRDLPVGVIKGALPISGTYLFGEQSGLSMRPRFLGDAEQGNDALASPLNHIHDQSPPFFVAWGEHDFPHLAQQSEDFVAALGQRGVAVSELELAGCDHLGASYASGDVDGEWAKRAVSFMQSVI